MVALSPACAEELGIVLDEESRTRSFVEVSGRKGLGVKADDLIDKLMEKALVEVNARHELASEKSAQIAWQIAVGALRYFLVKFARNSLIAFDFKEALSFEGETGPYLQYSVVRANNIFRKLEEVGDPSAAELSAFIGQGDLARFLDENIEFWELVYMAARLPEVLRQVMNTMEVAHLAKYAFTLAQKFNLFYHKHRIISEPDADRKKFLLLLVDIIRKQLEKALELMGMEVPEKM
jgi:arginyl-tRNA synthetase